MIMNPNIRYYLKIKQEKGILVYTED